MSYTAWGLPILAVTGAALVVLWHILVNGFLDHWDDPQTIVHNPAFNPPTMSGVLAFWDPRRPYMDLYVPLTYTVWGAIAALASRGADGLLPPAPYHAASLAVQIAGACAVFWIVRLLQRASGVTRPESVWAAACAAILFAVHPIQVEAVAWASGLKDLLSATLALFALGVHIHGALVAEEGGSRRWPAVGAAILVVLAIFAKPSAVAVIPMAAATDAVVLGRSWKAIGRSLAPWLVLAAPLIIVARIAQATTSGFVSPIWARPLVAADALAFYLMKLFVPIRLGIDYGRSPDWLLSSGQAAFTWVLPVAAAAAAILLRKRAPWAFVGAALFALGLLPTLGLSKFNFQYYSTVADHYVVLAMLGPAAALGLWLAGRSAGTIAVCALAILLPLGLLSHRQTLHWHDAEALFEHTLAVNPTSVAANVNLGLARLDAGKASEASERFRTALRVRPDDAEARSNLANALVALERHGEAIGEFRSALTLQPTNAVIHYNFAIALSRSGKVDEAMAEYREALRLHPGYAEAHVNLAGLLSKQGRIDEAIGHYQQAVRIAPGLEPARAGLRAALAARESAAMGERSSEPPR